MGIAGFTGELWLRPFITIGPVSLCLVKQLLILRLKPLGSKERFARATQSLAELYKTVLARAGKGQAAIF